MKFKAFFFAAVMALFSFSGLSAEPTTDPVAEDKTMTKKEYKAAVNELKAKVKSLREAKREADTRAERKAIREDIKDVKKEAGQLAQQDIDGGIYIGGGALIVIVLLLILL